MRRCYYVCQEQAIVPPPLAARQAFMPFPTQATCALAAVLLTSSHGLVFPITDPCLPEAIALLFQYEIGEKQSKISTLRKIRQL